MKINNKKLFLWFLAFLLSIPAFRWFQMQFGLENYGQEFGTYGQYNRVVRLVRENENFKIKNHGLSRRWDWRNFSHLDRFYVIVEDHEGKEVAIEFVRGSEEIDERNESVLKQIIENKISEQVGRYNSG